jgi:serine/threonine protein kinase
MSERFTDILGDWNTYKKYYTKTNKYLPFLRKSLNISCTEGVCGKGGFGKVFVSEANDGTKAIVKLIVLKNKLIKTEAIREAQTLQEITRLGISPEFYSFCIDTKKNYGILIMKYIKAITLHDLFQKLENAYFNAHLDGEIAEINRIAELNNSLIENLNLIISILHGNGIVHYDLKPANVLAELLPDGSYRLYLIDFGSAQHIGQPYKFVPETRHYSLIQALKAYNLTDFTDINNKSTAELNVNDVWYPKAFYKHYRDKLRNNETRKMKVSPVANAYSLSIIKGNHTLKKRGGRRTRD